MEHRSVRHSSKSTADKELLVTSISPPPKSLPTKFPCKAICRHMQKMPVEIKRDVSDGGSYAKVPTDLQDSR